MYSEIETQWFNETKHLQEIRQIKNRHKERRERDKKTKPEIKNQFFKNKCLNDLWYFLKENECGWKKGTFDTQGEKKLTKENKNKKKYGRKGGRIEEKMELKRIQ